jgi:hypothetical protein
VVPSLQVTVPLLLEEPLDDEVPADEVLAAGAAGAAVLAEPPAEADLLMPP